MIIILSNKVFFIPLVAGGGIIVDSGLCTASYIGGLYRIAKQEVALQIKIAFIKFKFIIISRFPLVTNYIGVNRIEKLLHQITSDILTGTCCCNITPSIISLGLNYIYIRDLSEDLRSQAGTCGVHLLMGSQLVTTQFSRLARYCSILHQFSTSSTLQQVTGQRGGGWWPGCSIMSHVSFGVHIISGKVELKLDQPGKCIFIEGSVAYH